MSIGAGPHIVGLAVFDGKKADVFVSDVTRLCARVRAIGGTMLPDRFRLVVSAEGLDTPCLVTERHGRFYTVAFPHGAETLGRQ
jgi:hypothetical protein